MKKPRKELVKALARCVDSLVQWPFIETGSAVENALKCDPKIWDHLFSSTIKTLNELGINEEDYQ